MASKRNIRRKSCQRKKQFGSRGEAMATVRWMRRKDPTNEWLGCYRCNSCGAWHIGHVPSNVRQLMTARQRLIDFLKEEQK